MATEKGERQKLLPGDKISPLPFFATRRWVPPRQKNEKAVSPDSCLSDIDTTCLSVLNDGRVSLSQNSGRSLKSSLSPSSRLTLCAKYVVAKSDNLVSLLFVFYSCTCIFCIYLFHIISFFFLFFMGPR